MSRLTWIIVVLLAVVIFLGFRASSNPSRQGGAEGEKLLKSADRAMDALLDPTRLEDLDEFSEPNAHLNDGAGNGINEDAVRLAQEWLEAHRHTKGSSDSTPNVAENGSDASEPATSDLNPVEYEVRYPRGTLHAALASIDRRPSPRRRGSRGCERTNLKPRWDSSPRGTGEVA